MKTIGKLLPMLLILATATACGSEALAAAPTTARATSTVAVGLANPAATYCVQMGYRHEIRTAADGSQSGVCILPDGSECDAWAFFRGECGMTFQATPTPTPAPAGAGTTPSPRADRAEGWVGTIVELPAGSQWGHYFLREDGEKYGINTIDPIMADQIKAHRGDGLRIAVWGNIAYDVPDTEGRQIQPERIELRADWAEGWVGTIVKLPAGSQFGHYFLREDGEKYGINSIDPAISELILAHRGDGIRIRVWGYIQYGVPDTEARQIQPERIEVD